MYIAAVQKSKGKEEKETEEWLGSFCESNTTGCWLGLGQRGMRDVHTPGARCYHTGCTAPGWDNRGEKRGTTNTTVVLSLATI